MIRRLHAAELLHPLASLPQPALRDSCDERAPRAPEATLLAALGLLLDAEHELAPEALERRIARELARFHGAHDVTLRIHPGDAASLAASDELARRHELSGTLTLVHDASLRRGGFVLVSADGEVDARVETRIARALARAKETT